MYCGSNIVKTVRQTEFIEKKAKIVYLNRKPFSVDKSTLEHTVFTGISTAVLISFFAPQVIY